MDGRQKMKTHLKFLHEWQIVRDGKQSLRGQTHILRVIHLKNPPCIPFRPRFSWCDSPVFVG